MLPPKRLETLINQAIEYQCEKCPFHNTNDKINIDTCTLLKDHICTKDQFPSTCIQTLNDHCDEVWFCKFSNDGTKLASGSKDGTLIIWDVNLQTFKLTHNKTYDEHTNGVAYMVWSPDDHYLIVCGTEECSELWIWDMLNKCLKKRLNNSPEDSFITAAWFSDGQSFVAGGTKGQFYYCVRNITRTFLSNC
jgi:WD repeat-containing protein 26